MLLAHHQRSLAQPAQLGCQLLGQPAQLALRLRLLALQEQREGLGLLARLAPPAPQGRLVLLVTLPLLLVPPAPLVQLGQIPLLLAPLDLPGSPGRLAQQAPRGLPLQ